MITYKVHLDTGKIRRYCIDNDLYTMGTVAEYCRMFDMAEECEYIEEVEQVAIDILIHSDTDRMQEEYGCDYKEIQNNVISGLLNNCVIFTDVNRF